MKFLFSLVGFLVLFNLTPYVSRSAHAGGTTPKKSWALEGDVTLGAGVLLEDDGDEVKILLRAEYRGYEKGTRNPKVSYRYFWTKFQIGFAASADEFEFNSVTVSIVPVQRITSDSLQTFHAFRFGAMDIRRNVDLGLAGSVNVEVIGFSVSTESPVLGQKLTKFAKISADLIGLRYIGFISPTQVPYVGMQFGIVNAAAGLSWNLNKTASIRLSLGAKENFSAGNSFVNESDFYAQIELILRAAHHRWQIYSAVGRYDFIHDLNDHSEYYLALGVNTTF